MTSESKISIDYWSQALFGKRYESLTDEQASSVWDQIENEVLKDDEKS